MNPTHLHQLAVEATRTRGLLPVFSPQALQELTRPLVAAGVAS